MLGNVPGCQSMSFVGPNVFLLAYRGIAYVTYKMQNEGIIHIYDTCYNRTKNKYSKAICMETFGSVYVLSFQSGYTFKRWFCPSNRQTLIHLNKRNNLNLLVLIFITLTSEFLGTYRTLELWPQPICKVNKVVNGGYWNRNYTTWKLPLS